MGSYWDLSLNGYPIISMKSYVSDEIMTIYQEMDKKVRLANVSERNELVWGKDLADSKEEETRIEYSAEASCICQRLDLMGFNLLKTKQDFEESKADKIMNLKEYLDEDRYFSNELRVLEKNNYDDFITEFKIIFKEGVYPISKLKSLDNCSELLKYICDNDDTFYGFPCSDFRYLLRAMLSIIPPSSHVTLDLTEVTNAGYYNADDEVSNNARDALNGGYAINSKIIVLTEGKSDAHILEKALKLLYPNLYNYYSFLDFTFGNPGGTGHLVNAIKFFAAAGIENRIIALFDNDTAAFSAISGLKETKLPNNIKLTTYPDIELANSYPTIGPNGLIKQNINGLACSIELYFGKDVLSLDSEDYVPIQWKGFDEKLNRYQGEILKKRELQEVFSNKIRKSEQSGVTTPEDWEDIISIFNHIFIQFQ
ncbi:MAG: hypothetical protein LHV68_05245 [Elusimicrobia bacterium]|nr:hypothetical protein [Candidatus Liberimonas magnetica]